MNGFQIDAVNNALDEARTEIKRLTLLHEISERQAELKIKELKAENERLQAHAISMIAEMGRENERLTAVVEQRQALIGHQRVESERLEAECNEFKRDLRRRRSENQRLKALLEKLQWTSIDKDNMEYSCRIPYNVMDELRALEPKPMRSNLGPGET